MGRKQIHAFVKYMLDAVHLAEFIGDHEMPLLLTLVIGDIANNLLPKKL